jgi:polyisoprenoid-binding protein YceI/rhodanese-related sulfurtransferase
MITRNDLMALLESGTPPALIDVMPGEVYTAAHIKGARNCCVYEIDFVEQVEKAAPDKAAAIVVYGSSAHSLSSSTAREKLSRAGFTTVEDYRGGMADWEGAGLPVERGQVLPEEKPRVGRHQIDTAKSQVTWTGRNINVAHSGTIALKGGWIEITTALAGHGEFTLDMDSVADTDLADSTYNRMLVAHLKSDDFLDTVRFPVATFKLKHITLNPHAHPGQINADIDGELTLKGVTGGLGFPALIELLPGGEFAAEAHFDIDRSRWGVMYGSGKFYEKLGKHLVHDIISLGVHIVTAQGAG